MKIYSNKGMYLESIINQTAIYYDNHNIGLIFKRNLPIDIYKVEEKKVNGVLKAKSLSDYYGLYQGYMVDFEAKQTNQTFFQLNNLKEHQFNHLQNIHKHKGISFLLLCFINTNHFYIISFEQLLILKEQQINKIDEKWCLSNAYHLNLIFPGILDFKDYFESVINA